MQLVATTADVDCEDGSDGDDQDDVDTRSGDDDVVTVVVQTMVTMVVGMGQIVLRTVAVEKNC